MPKYEAQCAQCGDVAEYLRSISNRNDTPICHGVPMTKGVFTAPKGFVFGKFDAFRSNVDGSLITSSRDLAEHNKRNNVVSMADGYSDETIRSGNFNKKEHKLDKAELKQDIAEALLAVKDGYRPEVQHED